MIVVLLSLATLAVIIWFYLRRKADVLPPGQIVYRDTDRRALNEPITSHRLRLTGKPDYLYALSDRTVPGEVKKHRAGKWGPRDRDVMQLLTYCVLLEDVWGVVVTHGLLEYSDLRFTIAYGPKERQRVLELAEAVRRDRMAADVARDHQEAWKCGRCGFSEVCGQAVPQRD
jgi:CRISPR-associated exonuclease Cas4